MCKFERSRDIAWNDLQQQESRLLLPALESHKPEGRKKTFTVGGLSAPAMGPFLFDPFDSYAVTHNAAQKRRLAPLLWPGNRNSTDLSGQGGRCSVAVRISPHR